MHTLMVDDVSLDYGSGQDVNHISFNCNAGEILGLLGANGAGKTTLCRLILGFIRAQTGAVHIQGADAFLDHARVAQKMSYVPGEVALNTRERA